MEEYFDGWRNIFNIKDNANRKQFWRFAGINYLFLLLFYFIIYEVIDVESEFFVPQILFLVSLITIGIRRMNDIEQPWYCLFIPFYNIYLLVQKGNIESEMETIVEELIEPKTPLGLKSFFKIVIASTLLGVVNLIMAFAFETKNTNLAYVFLMITISSIPISFVIILLLSLFSKSQVTSQKIVIYTLWLFALWFIIFLMLAYGES